MRDCRDKLDPCRNEAMMKGVKIKTLALSSILCSILFVS